MSRLREEVSIRKNEDMFQNLGNMDLIDQLIDQIEVLDLSFDNSVIGLFANHILVMFHRLQNNEQLTMPLDNDSRKQVSDQTLQQAKTLLESVVSKLGIELTEIECFLFAVYLEMGKGGSENE